MNEFKYTAITGANSGIGYETAKALARRGNRIFMICRNRKKADQARHSIVESTGNEKISTIIGDLGRQEDVKRVAESLRERTDRLDLLINNAGIVPGKREETAEGVEKSLAVNHLAPFMLTNLVLGLLDSAKSARVITVASEAHRAGKFEPENIQLQDGYNSMQAYANTKLFNIMFSCELAHRLCETTMTAYSLHPGTVRTNIDAGGGGGSIFTFLYKLGKPFMPSAKKGAKTLVWLATEPDLEPLTGSYFQNKEKAEPLTIAYNREKCRQLWELSAELTGIKGEVEV